VPGTVYLALAVFGIGALIAIVGGIMYMVVVLASVFTGKRVEPKQATLVVEPPPALGYLSEKEEHNPKLQPRGTWVLVVAFLMFFAAYYLSNWWLLGRLWVVR